MSKRARDHRARYRRDERYLDGRETRDDFDAHMFGWNKARSRNLSKWTKHREQLLFQDEETYEKWLFFGIYKPLKKGKK